MTRFLVVAFVLLTSISYAQKTVDKDKDRINGVCDSFMKLFVESKPHDALQLLKQNTVISESTIDTLEVTIDNQIRDYFPAYGTMLSYEFAVEKKLKDFIAKRFYILKFDKFYLKFDFTLYKAPTGWTVTNFNYNEELGELFN